MIKRTQQLILGVLAYLPWTITIAIGIDPYDSVVFITNSVQWPYDASTQGTDSFQSGTAAEKNEDTLILNQVVEQGFSFPNDFSFGVACSAYQYEGNRVAPSTNVPSGIGWSIWDVFCEKNSWLNPKGTNILSIPPTSESTLPSGQEAIKGFFPKFNQQDVTLIQGLGVQYYRLSISWPRLFPHAGMLQPNPEAIRYYQTILEKFKQRKIKVLVTLYHWDLPAWLYNFGDPNNQGDKTYGWLDMREAKDNLVLKEFQKYVASVYQAFGAYTPYFSTFNEPLTFTVSAFTEGAHAPGQYGWKHLRDKDPSLYGFDKNENLRRLPYLQAINIIKAHYIAYKTIHYWYRRNAQNFNFQPPVVSIVLNSDWAEPYRVNCDKKGQACFYNQDDITASLNNMDYMLGWWLDPIMYGRWPSSMERLIYSIDARFPTIGIDKRDSSCLAEDGKPMACPTNQKIVPRLSDYIARGGALDAITLNHYTGYFVADFNYANDHINSERKPGAVPPNQYGSTPADCAPGWNRDQNNFLTQFRYYKYYAGSDSQEGPIPKNPNRAYIIGNSGNKPWLRQTWFPYRKLLQYIDAFYLQNISSPHNRNIHHVVKTKSNINFKDLDIYLTENGTSIFQESQTADTLHQDSNRIQYLLGNLAAVQQAVNEDGIAVKLYTYWSIDDNFEWSEGYDSRFGLVWIDYDNNFSRIPKQSYQCYKAIIQSKSSRNFPEQCRIGVSD